MYNINVLKNELKLKYFNFDNNNTIRFSRFNYVFKFFNVINVTIVSLTTQRIYRKSSKLFYETAICV